MATRDGPTGARADATQDEQSWSEEEDVDYAQRVLEGYIEGRPEYAIEEEAAREVNDAHA